MPGWLLSHFLALISGKAMIFPAGRSLPQKRLFSPLTNAHGLPASPQCAPLPLVWTYHPSRFIPRTPGFLLTGPTANTAFPQTLSCRPQHSFPNFTLNLNGIFKIIKTSSQSNKSLMSLHDVPHSLEINTRLDSWFGSESSCKRYWTGPRNETQMSARELGICLTVGKPKPTGR